MRRGAHPVVRRRLSHVITGLVPVISIMWGTALVGIGMAGTSPAMTRRGVRLGRCLAHPDEFLRAHAMPLRPDGSLVMSKSVGVQHVYPRGGVRPRGEGSREGAGCVRLAQYSSCESRVAPRARFF